MEEETKEKVKNEVCIESFWKGSKAFLLIAVIVFLMLAAFALGQISGVTIASQRNNNEPIQIRNAGEGKYDIVEDKN